MRTLTLIRGLPGAGKSTVAVALASCNPIDHIEADHYFDTPDGYKFDGSKLAEAHAYCLRETEESLKQGFGVVVSNTFSTLKEMEPYLNLAKQYGAALQIIEVHSDFKSEHSVPEATIERMRQRWEKI